MSNLKTSKLTIRHPDRAVIKTLVKAYMENCLFGEFCSCPSEIESMPSVVGADELSRARAIKKYGTASRDEWRVINWGTSTEIGVRTGKRLEVASANEIRVEFATEGMSNRTELRPPFASNNDPL